MEITKDPDQNNQLPLNYQNESDNNFNVNNKNTFCCNICGESFLLDFHLKNHMEEHKTKTQVNFKSYKCEFCEKKFKLNIGLNRHVQTCHLGSNVLNNYKCSICEIFIDKVNYNKHMKTHNNKHEKFDFTLNLKLCKLNGVWKSKLNFVYKCNICFQKFHTESNLVEHKDIHKQGGGQLQRENHLMFVSNFEGYSDHKQKVHNISENKCLKCNYNFDLKQNLDCHLLHCTKSSRNIWKKFQNVKQNINTPNNETQVSDDHLNIQKSKTTYTNLKDGNITDQIETETNNECSENLNKEKNKYTEVNDQKNTTISNIYATETVSNNFLTNNCDINGINTNITKKSGLNQIDSTNSNEFIVKTPPSNQKMNYCVNIKKEKDLCTNVIEDVNSNPMNTVNEHDFSVDTISPNLINNAIKIKKEKGLCTSGTDSISLEQMNTVNEHDFSVDTISPNLINDAIKIKKEKGLSTSETDSISLEQMNTTNDYEFTVETISPNLINDAIKIKKEKGLCTSGTDGISLEQMNTTNSNEFVMETTTHNPLMNNFNINIKKESADVIEMYSSDQMNSINDKEIVPYNLMTNNHITIKQEIDECASTSATNNDAFNMETSSTNSVTNYYSHNMNMEKSSCTKELNLVNDNIACVENIYFSIRKMPNTKNTSITTNYNCEQNNLLFICNICKNSLSTNIHSFALHMSYHRESKLHECLVCNQKFGTVILWKNHMSYHKNQSELIFSKSQIDSKTIESNIYTATSEISEAVTPQSLPKTSMTLRNRENRTSIKYYYELDDFYLDNDITQNVNNSAKKSKNRCDTCNNTFPCALTLMAHQTLHNNQLNSIESQYNLDINSVAIEANENSSKPLGNNLNNFVNDNIKRKKFCFICKKKFTHRGALSNHMKSHSLKQYKCQYCNKMFNYKKSFITHENSHGGKYNEVNNINFNETNIEVNKEEQKENSQHLMFTNDELNDNHLDKISTDCVNETIIDESIFCCSICKKQFSNQGTYSSHMKSHTSNLYKCQYCDRNFNYKPALISHEKSHRYIKKSKKTKTNNKNFNDNINNEIDTNEQQKSCDNSLLVNSEFNNSLKDVNSTTLVNDKLFYCSTCKKQFCHQGALSNHIKSHTTNLKYKCRYCGKMFSVKKDIISHEKNHNIKNSNINLNEVNIEIEEDEQQIDNCNKYLSADDTNLIKKDGIWFVCDVCENKFSTPFLLISHRNLHSDIQPYVCKICNKSYVIKYEWNRHLKSHYMKNNIKNTNTSQMTNYTKIKDNSTQKKNSFKCQYCKKEFNLLRNWKKHLSFSKECLNNQTHPIRPLETKDNYTKSVRYECNICKRTYSKDYNLKVHIQSVHKQFKNNITNTDVAVQHKQLVTNKNIQQTPNISDQCYPVLNNIHSCNLCDKTYSSNANLYRHQFINHGAGNNPITCEICGRSFKHKYTYRAHFLMKHKKFLTNRKIISKKNYNTQLNTVSLKNKKNVRKYICEVCKMRFADNTSLQIHSQIHTTNKYPCKDCGQQFETNITLGEHILKDHNQNKDHNINNMTIDTDISE